jgi:hypothetical protein
VDAETLRRLPEVESVGHAVHGWREARWHASVIDADIPVALASLTALTLPWVGWWLVW